ncbi:MAG: hypothetical protein ACK4RK_10265 [Gemmataceae bacterium]
MTTRKRVSAWLAERRMSLDQLIAASSLERKIIQAILLNRYTPSPVQRQRVADALGVTVAEIDWDYAVPVSHIHGHGPQFGRSP